MMSDGRQTLDFYADLAFHSILIKSYVIFKTCKILWILKKKTQKPTFS